MNFKDSPEFQAKILQLQKDVDEAQKTVAELKEKGYDIHSPTVMQANKIWENRLKMLDNTLK